MSRGRTARTRGVAAGRSAQRGTSVAATGGGGRSAPDPEYVRMGRRLLRPVSSSSATTNIRYADGVPPYGEVAAVAERVDARLAASAWNMVALEQTDASIDAAAEVAVFALKLAGKRRQAHRGGRCGRLIVGFALAACVALTSFAAACDAPSAAPEATQAAISQLPTVSGASAAITAQPRASPAQFADLVLLDASSTAGPWAVLVPRGGDVPVLVDPVGAG